MKEETRELIEHVKEYINNIEETDTDLHMHITENEYDYSFSVFRRESSGNIMKRYTIMVTDHLEKNELN